MKMQRGAKTLFFYMFQALAKTQMTSLGKEDTHKQRSIDQNKKEYKNNPEQITQSLNYYT